MTSLAPGEQGIRGSRCHRSTIGGGLSFWSPPLPQKARPYRNITHGCPTVSTIRGALFGIGAILAVSMIGGGWFYVSHAWIEVDLRDLSRHARHAELTVTEEEPRENASVVVLHEPAQGRVLRLRVPASDIVLHVLASYPDQQERRLNFPMLLSPGIAWSDKFGKLTLPGADEVLAHPLMAYVPAERWVETPGTPPNVSKHPFWIDIYPVTVFEYEPILKSLLQQSKLSIDQSVLAKACDTREPPSGGRGPSWTSCGQSRAHFEHGECRSEGASGRTGSGRAAVGVEALRQLRGAGIL